LFADLHALLDNLKTTSEKIELRTTYYEIMIKTILKRLNVSTEKLKFIRGSSFQLSSNYTSDVYKIATMTSIHDAKKAGSEVVKQSDNPKLSGLIYPILQALDEQYLDADVELGGVDQRKLFTFASDMLPLVGYKKRIHLMTPMLTAIDAKPIESSENLNISESKMSSSNINSKIDMLDSKNEIKKKINRAYCLEGDLSFNPVIELMKLIIFPLQQNLGIETFRINRSEKYGGPLEYDSMEKIEQDFTEKILHPQDLKLGIIDFLNTFIEPIRTEFSTKEMQQLLKNAYV
jgi:tyrosyl-tRNA synthetase